MVKAGAFREDLYYRLNVVRVKLPALRERREDLGLLCSSFLGKSAKARKMQPKVLSAEALKKLMQYAWPGNVRELQNEIQRAELMAGTEDSIQVAHLSEHIREPQLAGGMPGALPQGSLKEAIAALEKKFIAATLERVGGNKSEAAKILSISRSSLIAKVKEYGLES
jgi:transcriptional regulator with PAS, ATPase and Fis domain